MLVLPAQPLLVINRHYRTALLPATPTAVIAGTDSSTIVTTSLLAAAPGMPGGHAYNKLWCISAAEFPA